MLFICATDEHGTPAELSALEAGLSIEEYCARMHAIQADIYRRFGLSFDHFGRSSSAQNRALTQHFYERLNQHGFIWLDEGLRPRCITRDLQWGVPVPRPGFSDKVFYVWFDAPIEYIGATKEWADEAPGDRDWRSWWYGAEDVVYTQFMAKDNVPFHAVFWPAMILGTREPWTLPAHIKSFNWLTYYGGKFSTSQKRGVFLDAALEVQPADCWRYFLLAQSPESDDTHFTWEQFAAVVNKDLVGNFGNFVNRTLKLTHAHFGGTIPEGGTVSDAETRLQEDCIRLVNECRTLLRKLQLRKAIQTLRGLWSLGNVYLDERAPWTLVKTDREQAAMVLRTAIQLIRLFASAAHPVIPFTCERVFDALHLSHDERSVPLPQLCALNGLSAGRRFTVPSHLFQRISSEEVAELKQRFSGQVH
ncbi:methionyl-tRNA synthetase [Alicyclobacillus macrosporangiidus]|uniref:Methionyl-tRNA synthetase n=1 Tax=Alicyclobacillus macrosporangiidus TaxID=392015 RepID=A0A1I7KV19_9BACL|nr:methionyl-tRNA synthetase [Alicyclobacillus macrosporangiidus]